MCWILPPPTPAHPRCRVEHLARTHEIIESPHHLFDWRDLVPNVQPVEIDVIRPQPFQAGLDRLHHVLALVATRVGVCARLTAEADDGILYLVATITSSRCPAMNSPTSFSLEPWLHVRRVDEITARFAESIVDLSGFIFAAPHPNLRRRSSCQDRDRRRAGRYGQEVDSSCLNHTLAHLQPIDHYSHLLA